MRRGCHPVLLLAALVIGAAVRAQHQRPAVDGLGLRQQRFGALQKRRRVVYPVEHAKGVDRDDVDAVLCGKRVELRVAQIVGHLAAGHVVAQLNLAEPATFHQAEKLSRSRFGAILRLMQKRSSAMVMRHYSSGQGERSGFAVFQRQRLAVGQRMAVAFGQHHLLHFSSETPLVSGI